MKKVLATMLLVAMMLSTSLVAFAAEQNYSLGLSNSSVTFYEDGAKTASNKLEENKVTLTQSEEGGIAVQFRSSDATIKKVSLGTQTTLTVSGKIDSLELSAKMGEDTKVIIASDAQIKNLVVDSPSKVTVNGTVNRVKITNGRSRVTVQDGAVVSQVDTVYEPSIAGVSIKQINLISEKEASSSGSAYSSPRYYYTDKYGNRYYYYDEDGYRRYYWDDDGYTYYDGWYYYDEDGHRHYYREKDHDFRGSYYYDAKNQVKYYDYDRPYSRPSSRYDDDVIRVSAAYLTDDETLKFQCNVAGASVYWNGEKIGETHNGSNSFSVSADNRNTLEVEKSGYFGDFITVRY